MFDWLKNRVKNAVLSGVNEALAELAAAPQEQPAPAVLLLPAPEDDQPRVRKGKDGGR